MRLRNFEAPSVAEAMHRMRTVLGDDAVILATQELAHGVRLTAAVELASDDLSDLLAPGVPPAIRVAVERCLTYHRAPAALRDALLSELARAHAADPAAALAQALAARFRFVPLALPSARPVALVGPPGVGKTAALVRLAAQALVAGSVARVVAAGTPRAGGLAQLQALLEPLRLAPVAARGPAELGQEIGKAGADAAVLLVDTPGVNPFDGGEVAALADLLRAAGAEPVLVLPAGIERRDGIEVASNFAAIGARRLIVSKLDAARRLGSVLGFADVGLAFAGVSIGPAIGKGTTPLTAAGLARVLLHRADSAGGCPDL
jgi:flagellar biosynthesis protein FlhF